MLSDNCDRRISALHGISERRKCKAYGWSCSECIALAILLVCVEKNAGSFLPYDNPNRDADEAMQQEWDLNHLSSVRSGGESDDPIPPILTAEEENAETTALLSTKHKAALAYMAYRSFLEETEELARQEEYSRYCKLRQEAVENSQQVTDPFYQSAAFDQLTALFTFASEVDAARQTISMIKIKFIRDKAAQLFADGPDAAAHHFETIISNS